MFSGNVKVYVNKSDREKSSQLNGCSRKSRSLDRYTGSSVAAGKGQIGEEPGVCGKRVRDKVKGVNIHLLSIKD